MDLITNAVRAAVGMSIDSVEQKPYNGCWAEVILHSEQEGVFEQLWVSEYVKPNVVEKDLWVNAGDKVKGFTAANEAIGTLILRFDDEKQLDYVMSNIENYVKIILK